MPAIRHPAPHRRAQSRGAYPANVAAYINGVFRGTIAVTDHMPAGLHLYLP
jgi:hypothetical protein